MQSPKLSQDLHQTQESEPYQKPSSRGCGWMFLLFIIFIVFIGILSGGDEEKESTIITQQVFSQQQKEGFEEGLDSPLISKERAIEEKQINEQQFLDDAVDLDITELERFTLEGPKIMDFQWQYKSNTYRITETFYKTAYEYYSTKPHVYTYTCTEGYCPGSDELQQRSFKMFLEEAENDDTISKIVASFKTIGKRNQFNNDEIVEMIVAFVQSIPYDFAKANLSKISPRYPYEVLYDNKGVCSGKSFLAVLLLREMGYGVTLLDFDNEEHVAPAIKCPTEYSWDNSGYCFAEVTNRFRIGEIPSLEVDTGRAKERATIEIKLFGEENDFERNQLELKNAKIYEIADGISYQGIIKTSQTIHRIETLEIEIDELEEIMSQLLEGVNQLENNVNYSEQQAEAAFKRHEVSGDQASYNEYERLYSQYESVYSEYQSKLKEYNDIVAEQNSLIDEYNNLIEDFYE